MIHRVSGKVRQALYGTSRALGSACGASGGRRRMPTAGGSTAVRTWLDRLRGLRLYQSRSEPAYATRLLGDDRRWPDSRLSELADDGPAGEAGGLACYRDVARVPVLAVNMRHPQDRMLLWVTSVAIRVGIDVL